jgi:hydrogenase-4 component F
LAGCFGVAVLAIIAFPPFALFASELGMARAGFAAAMDWQRATALLLVLVIAAALVNHTSRMLLGAPVAPSLEQGERQGEQQGEERGAAIETAAPEELQPEGIGPAVGASVGLSVSVVPVVVETATGATSAAVRRSRPGAEIYAMGGALLTCAVLGLTLGPLGPLLAQATAIVTRTP